jgi:desampylase
MATSTGRSGGVSGTLALRRSAIEAIAAHAERSHPHEACGLLIGLPVIERAVPAGNVAVDPVRRFEVDPAALIAAHKAERAGGSRLAGYYHSHPTGAPVPSAADREAAGGDGRVWAIVAPGEKTGWTVRFWRDSPSGFEALSSTVIDG